MSSTFLQFIKSAVDIPEEQQIKFNQLISVVHLNKGDKFVTQGQFPKVVGFVQKGLFRYHYLSDDGADYTKNFFLEGSVLSSYSAMTLERKSYFSIEAMEDSIVVQVNYVAWKKLFVEDACWNRFLILLLEKGFMIKEERERQFLLCNAEERYKIFLNQYPEIEARIKQQYIASYLRIAPESLSRIRRKMGLLT